MAMFGGGRAAPDPTRYLFVDGAYLRELIDDISARYFNGVTLEIDYRQLSSHFKKTFYYDCLPGRRQTETEEEYQKRLSKQEALFERLRRIAGWHVYLGTVRGEGGRLRQKQVDTMMAVDMLAHSYRKNASEVTLLAGDLDFKPVLDALVQDGMYVVLWYDRKHASKELIESADNRQPLSILTVSQWLTPRFRKQYPLPAPYSTPENEARGHVLVCDGTMESGRKIELYQKDGSYVIAFEEGANEGYRMYLKGSARELLEKYVDDAFESFHWTPRRKSDRTSSEQT